MRILVVEDDEVIAESLKEAIESAGFVVDVALDGEAGLDMAVVGPYALILLDLMLPKRNGMDVCAAIRRGGNRVPILMLTARDAVEDRVKGLDCGADDYLPKPFDFKELMARVRALLRRDAVHKAQIVQVADLVIDSGARKVTRGGEEVALTPREYELLEALARNEGRTLTREVIQEQVWGDDESYSNVVSFHVALLRKKIDSGDRPRLIHTVHGVGYVLKTPEAGT
ncbi:MAG: response regulator transcription factor [Fimbriimonadaceae bacterium]|nr:response regulator transcription factor [Fimbriimonadaceae bacterium]